jgi:low affinity Fe/Cu permease
MDKQQHKSKKQKSKYLDKVSKKELILGSIIATYIAITPYLFTLWEGVPNQETWDTFLGSYTSPYYESVQILVWTLLGKLIPLLLLIIWMFTNRHWWFHVLIVPIAMYVYQIITVLNDDLEFSDENQILYLLPVMAIIIPSIYLIRAKMFNKLNDAGKTMEELEDELKTKPSSFKDYF